MKDLINGLKGFAVICSVLCAGYWFMELLFWLEVFELNKDMNGYGNVVKMTFLGVIHLFLFAIFAFGFSYFCVKIGKEVSVKNK